MTFFQNSPFSACIAVDWSGAKARRTAAICVARAAMDGSAPQLLAPPDGGLWSRELVADFLIGLARQDQRTLVGIDCNFGYAEAVAARHTAGQQPLWAVVDALCRQTDNFYAEGFWTHPSIRDDFWQAGKQPLAWHGHRRLTEQACAAQGYGWPESPFKLIGPKQVGKGGLAGMRMAHALKQQAGARIAFWPFEDTRQAPVVVTEIYPRLFIRQAAAGNAKVRDAATVNTILHTLGSQRLAASTADRLTDHQTDALIAAAGMRAHLATTPNPLDVPQSLRPTLRLEGWIFGVKVEHEG
jgi:hypothetical protein